MKINNAIRLITLTCTAMSTIILMGCQHDQKSDGSRPVVAQSAPKAGDKDRWEYKTVEQAMSETDLRQNMDQWQREGWAVLSISKALPQPDGTVHRKVELRRAK